MLFGHSCVRCSFVCGEPWHDPVQCKVLKLWIKKCDDDSETSNWIAANTKASQLTKLPAINLHTVISCLLRCLVCLSFVTTKVVQ